MSRRLSGINPLAYIGVEPLTPPQFEIHDRAPTSNDYISFNVGTIWLHKRTGVIPTAEDIYVLVSKDAQVATWVALAGTSAMETLTGDSGGAVGPDASDNINLLGTAGRITTTGNPATNTITWDIGSDIAASYPTDAGTAVPVAGVLNVFGGTGISTSGAGNTITITNTDASTSFNQIITQVFTSNDTYTPTAGMQYCIIEVVGGGGGGGGAAATAAGKVAAAAGGGGGGYSRGVFSAATIGASQAVTVGTGGAGGAAGANDGSPGTATSVGALISANGGFEGGGAVSSTMSIVSGGIGALVGTGGELQVTGGTGSIAFGLYVTTGAGTPAAYAMGGSGGSAGGTFFNGGGEAVQLAAATGQQAGNNARSYGGGGGGAISVDGGMAAAGGDGFDGIVIITEFVSV